MKARHYDSGARPVDHFEASVAELHWDDGRSVQISGGEVEHPSGKHLMIRVWPENGTNEYGGDNTTSLTIHLEPHEAEWRVIGFHIDKRHLDD